MNVELRNTRVVAIDGGTATGKGRLIEELAALMRSKGVPVLHLSTGSLYRAVALAAIEKVGDIVPDLAEALRELKADELVELVGLRQIEMHGGVVWMDGEPVDPERLKGPGVGTGASVVGLQLPVREVVGEVVRRQVNEFDGYVLVDGRDITHTVLPEAALKLLLTVAPEVAAARSREHTLEEIVARDERDRGREHGRLMHPDDPGEGVQVVATDDHSPESARDHVYGLMREVWPELSAL